MAKAWDATAGTSAAPALCAAAPKLCRVEGARRVGAGLLRPCCRRVLGSVRRMASSVSGSPRLSLQWLVGLSFFLFPGASFSLRSRYRPQHVFFGAAIFLLSVGTALLGLKEALLFKLG